MGLIYDAARWLVFTCFVAAGLVAATHWAVRARWLDAFGPFPRLVREVSAPFVRWMERRLLRAGGNPVQAPYWLFLAVVVGGLILLGVLAWLLRFIAQLVWAAQSPGSLGYLLVNLAFQLVIIALIVRVVASWIGIGEYRRWMRPVYHLTEWLLGPLRRVIPPLGLVDITPLVAYFILILAQRFVLKVIGG
ncbi:MAG TPA: YggT family protein [Gemmatimonadales bacterium]|nr:YggT family protein [Gemmatimonadales bacterium]